MTTSNATLTASKIFLGTVAGLLGSERGHHLGLRLAVLLQQLARNWLGAGAQGQPPPVELRSSSDLSQAVEQVEGGGHSSTSLLGGTPPLASSVSSGA
jgi:hypothetical protein